MAPSSAPREPPSRRAADWRSRPNTSPTAPTSRVFHPRGCGPARRCAPAPSFVSPVAAHLRQSKAGDPVTATSARYRVTGFAISLAALAYVQRVAISQAAEGIQSDLHLGKAQLGLIFGAFGLSYALFEVPNGLLGDRLGVRSTLTRIVVAWSAFTALTGAAWNFTSLWVARFLFGAGEAGCFPNLTRMLSAWLPLQARLRAQALMWACTRWAGAVTPLMVLGLVRWHGWRWAFVVLAALGCVWAIAFFLWYRDDPAEHPAVNEEELALLQGARAMTTQEGASHWYRSLLAVPVLILLFQYFC